jgi:hypothetical protein
LGLRIELDLLSWSKITVQQPSSQNPWWMSRIEILAFSQSEKVALFALNFFKAHSARKASHHQLDWNPHSADHCFAVADLQVNNVC